MLFKIKTIKTETKFVERKGKINISKQHIDSINKKINQSIDEHEAKNDEAIEKILDKIYK